MTRRDPAVFAEFVAARSSSLFRTAYLMVGEHALAQDLLQEAFTKTYVAWPRLREVGNAEAYTRKVITTTAISWRRKKSWHERPTESLPEQQAPVTSDLGARDWLWTELQKLPPRQRAAVVAVVGAGSFVLPDLIDDSTAVEVAGAPIADFSERRPSYSVGSVIHYGDTQLDVGHVVRSYLQTDEGFVFTSDGGTVWFTDGERAEEIGSTSARGYYLAADDTGPLAAWVDFTAKAPEFVVYDTLEGEEVLRTSDGNRPGLTSYRDTDAAYVYGVDDGAVYWRSSQGAVRHDLATGDSTVLDPDAMPFDIEDIANGQIAHTTEPAPGNDEGNLAVSADLDGGEPLPRAWNGTLSPDATYIVTDQADVMDVYDVASHERVTPDVDGYQFWFGYGWADESTVLVVATTGGEQAEEDVAIDHLACDIPTGVCTKELTTTVDFEDFALPVGERLG